MIPGAKKYSVLIDLDRLKDLNNGLGQSALNFGNALSRIGHPLINFTFLVPKKFEGYFGNNVGYEVISLKRRYFPQYCRTYDLWYTLHQDSSYFPGNRQTPMIININDLNFLGEKSSIKAVQRLAKLQKKVKEATLVTAISNYTAGMIKDNLDLSGIPVRVIYFGVEVKRFENPAKPAFVPQGKIMFNIGVVREKKNSLVLIPFMKQLSDDYKLIIAGDKNSGYARLIEEEVKKLGLTNRVFLPGLISDEDKYWLYSNCEAVLFPSKFEGMGFPPIEAMRLGKPVFASTFSSIPEVCGEFACYWTDFDPKQMAVFFTERLKEFQGNPAMSEKVRNHSLKYTWDICAGEYLKLFLDILTSKFI